MDIPPYAAVPCEACRLPAEPPLLPVCDVTGERTRVVLCLACHAVLTRWVAAGRGDRRPGGTAPAGPDARGG